MSIGRHKDIPVRKNPLQGSHRPARLQPAKDSPEVHRQAGQAQLETSPEEDLRQHRGGTTPLPHTATQISSKGLDHSTSTSCHHVVVIQQHHEDTHVPECPQPGSVQSTMSNPRGRTTEPPPPPPPGLSHSLRNVIDYCPSWGNSRTVPPPSLGPGAEHDH